MSEPARGQEELGDTRELAEHPAVYLVLALLTVLAGLVARQRENGAR